MNLRVFYGFARLTEKVIKKRQVVVLFENAYNYKNDEWVYRHIHVVYTREQTEAEKSDAAHYNRTFVNYGYFVDERPYKGDLEKVLEHNFIADENHVTVDERNTIRQLLFKEYFRYYGIQKPKIKGQLQLNLF